MLMALAHHPLLKRKVPFLQGTVQNFIGLATCKCLQLRFPLSFACAINRASDISRDFQGQICGKIGRFRTKRVKIHRKIGQFRGIFAGEKSNFEEKLADFVGNFREELR